ncbi:unnamed protein product [Candida verbasci]|uniref:Carbohydrate kinase PfkB domain-containing protein n=1 Tax=Candida verbasci TaxID=1227364 RepID=A0A9W4TVY0_9ASCO|nr:unnamed protein product [Candida verbasci]
MSIVTTLGMFIIDENQYLDDNSKSPDLNITGGAGTYCVIGSRIISPCSISHLISGIVDKGSDFPSTIVEELNSWQTGIIYRVDDSRLTTRGCNIYKDGIRSFTYVSPKLRLEVDDILKYDNLKTSKTYHLICSIERCESIINKILLFNPGAIFIYEPLPDDCKFENLEKLKKLLPLIEIFSPNLDEAIELTNKNELGEISEEFRKYLKIKGSGVIIRCGKDGCYIKTKTGDKFSLPAYHQDQKHVIDVTGGGNSFCGGFIMGYYLSNRNWLVGGICGNIASGCIIEKLGMPKVEENKFNGLSFKQRLNKYLDDNKEIDEKIEIKKDFSWIEEE